MEQKIIVAVVLVLIVGALATFIISPESAKPAVKATDVPAGMYTELATCIKDSGATFYGAYWCPHCKEQKELFGDAVSLLPYVECATPGSNTPSPVCTSAGVEGYPTWIFKDGKKLSGTVPIATLASSTGCMLPQPAL